MIPAGHFGLLGAFDVGQGAVQQRIGVEIAIAGIYLEESGLPMPVPSEVSVGYLGQRLSKSPSVLFATWLGLTALIDGLWLEWCLDPDNFAPCEAVELCEAWVDRLESKSGLTG